MSTIPTPPDFRSCRTHRSLISAWHGEEQSRRQYTAAAALCERGGLHVLAHAFTFTALQEKEHAAICRGLLVAYGGETPPPAPDAPPLPDAPEALLSAVLRTEEDEAAKLYPACARTALEEDYPRIALTFQRLAETELLHARRFRQYAAALQDDSLFRSDTRTGWLCIPCGHLHYGCEAPGHCGTCGRDRGHFIRSDFHPFTVVP